jgi:hypothetical protein
VKAAVLLIIALVAMYGVWQLLDQPQRDTVKSLLGKHAWVVISIVSLVLLALGLAAKTPATNIL